MVGFFGLLIWTQEDIDRDPYGYCRAFLFAMFLCVILQTEVRPRTSVCFIVCRCRNWARA